MPVPIQLDATLSSILRSLARLRRDECGQDIVEYALIAVSMGLLTVAGVHGLANSIANDINIVLNGFNAATGAQH